MKLPIGKIICGGCRKTLPKFPTDQIKLILTDPPYGIEKEFGRRSSNRTKMIGDDLSFTEYLLWFEDIYSELFRILKVEGTLLTECAISYLSEIIAILKKIGFVYQYQFILYTVNNMRRGKTGYSHYNSMLWFSKGEKSTRRYGSPDVIKAPLCSSIKKFRHPSPKNVKHYSKLIHMFTIKGDIVLDPFVGSGTTCIAAEQLGRRWIGIEIDKDYCKIARKRIAYEKRNPGFRIFK